MPESNVGSDQKCPERRLTVSIGEVLARPLAGRSDEATGRERMLPVPGRVLGSKPL